MENVIHLNNQEVFTDIMTFLDGCETETTRSRYWSSIKLFFGWKYKDLNIEYLQPNHISQIEYGDVKKFKTWMRDKKKYSFNSINNTMSSLSSLFRELSKMGNNKYGINPEQLVVKRSKVTDDESIGDIELEEFEEWIDYIKQQPPMKKPKIKCALLETALTTGIRKSGLLSLKFSDLRKSKDYYILRHSLKGKKAVTAIKNEDAEMLLSLQETSDKNEPIFNISAKSVERLMAELHKEFQIPDERNVSFHSIRRLSGQLLYDQTKDITIVKNHLNHSDINTSLGYVQRKMDLDDSPSLYLRNDVNKEDVEDLTTDEWKAIFDKLPRSAKHDILKQKKELGL